MFLGTFLLAGAVGLFHTFSRAPEYRASARIHVNPGLVQVEAARPDGGSRAADAPRTFLTELQVLTSRPILEAAIERLGARFPTEVALQTTLTANAAEGTDVVELTAMGRDPALVAALVNEVIAAYREQLEQAHRATSGEALAQIDEELARLAARVAARRKTVEDFGARHNVVSLEREENQVLARVKGLGTALNNANEKLAAAEGRLHSLEQSAAQGKPVVRARDNPTLANLEQRASQIREELGELERSYTPQYLALDSKVRAQRTRLTELERQIAAQRQLSQQASLAEAEEEVAGLRETVGRIRKQLADERGTVQLFSARFNEYRALREELTQLESLYRDSTQRKARLEAGERARRPSVKVLETASVPREPWRPLYVRDAGISVAGAFLLALLLMWVVELFNRQEPQPTILVPRPLAHLAEAYGGQLGAPPGPYLPAGSQGLLTAEQAVPRELAASEIRALLAAATPEARLAALLVLGGVSPEELAALEANDIDLARRELHLRGESPRTLAMLEPACAMLERLSWAPGIFADLASHLLYAAHDAGLERPAEVTPAALRHTYVAFLARQGLRLADLVKLVGRLSAGQVDLYSRYAPAGRRLTLSEINAVIDGIGPAGQAGA